MSAKTQPRLYALSTGRDFFHSKVEVKRVTAERLTQWLRKFHAAKLTRAEYMALSKREKSALKKESGFFIGGDGGGLKVRDSWKFSSLATLDLDDLTPERAQASIEAIKALGTHAVFYSTASHSPEKPRLRVVIFLSADVLRDDYSHLIERISSRLPEGAVSSESLKPTQIMYRPQRCTDGEELFLELPGRPLDVAPLLAEPRKVVMDPDRAENVTPAWDKPGIVGKIARRYGEDLDAAIEELGIEHIPYERSSVGPTCGIGEARYTRVGASGADGAIWYPDDGHMFSHHGASDPGAGEQQTIFDIYRLTNYKKLDKDVSRGTPPAQRPSHKAAEKDFLERFPEMRPAPINAQEEFEDLGPLPAEEQKSPANEKTSGLKLRHISEVLSQPSSVRWLIKGIIEREVLAVMSGPRSTYKSFVALDWAMRAAVAGNTIVLLSAEGAGMDRRVAAWLKERAPDTDVKALKLFAFEQRLDLNNPESRKALHKALADLKLRPALIVVDTYSKFVSVVEDDNTEVKNFLRSMAAFAASAGASILFVAHTGHQEKGRPRGASALEADTDCAFVVSKLSDGVTVRVSRERFKDSPELPALEYTRRIVDLKRIDEDGDLITSVVLDAVEGPREVAPAPPPAGANEKAIWTELQGSPSGVTRVKLLEAAKKHLAPSKGERDKRSSNLSRALSGMISKGIVREHGEMLFLSTPVFDRKEADPLGADEQVAADSAASAAAARANGTHPVSQTEPDWDDLPRAAKTRAQSLESLEVSP
jgi:AAA domain